MKPEQLLSISGILLAFAVVLGAFGAHVLENVLSPERMQTWETAVLYHALNSLGLLAMALAMKQYNLSLNIPAWLVLAGIFIFSGSLYTLCLTGIGALGAITPIGGVSFIAGWSVFAWKFARLNR